VELLHEGIPLPLIQRQLGHAHLSTTGTYLQGISSEEIISTVHARRAPDDARQRRPRPLGRLRGSAGRARADWPVSGLSRIDEARFTGKRKRATTTPVRPQEQSEMAGQDALRVPASTRSSGATNCVAISAERNSRVKPQPCEDQTLGPVAAAALAWSNPTLGEHGGW
jgi:hypothetical protein